MTLTTALADTDARYAAGDHVAHLHALRRFSPTISRAIPEEQAAWAAWMGVLHSVTGGRPQVVQRYCQRSATLATAHNLHGIRAMAQSCLSQQAYVVGNLEAGVQAGMQAYAVFTAHGTHRWACRTLWHVSTIANARGDWNASKRYCQQALRQAEQADDARAQQVSRWRLGGVAILAGQIEEGLWQCEQVLGSDPSPTDRMMATVMYGCGLVKAGAITRGIQFLETAIHWLGQAQLHYTKLQGMLYLGESYRATGTLRRARTLFMDIGIASQRAGYRLLEQTARQRFRQTFAAYDPLFYGDNEYANTSAENGHGDGM